MMTFFDVQPEDWDEGTNFYFNVLMRIIAVRPGSGILDHGVQEYWDMDHLTDARPYCTLFYLNYFLDKDTDWEIECVPHCVVGVRQGESPEWIEMIDFDTQEPWRID